MFTIREATEKDDDAVGQLLVDAFIEQYAKKMPRVVVTDSRKETLRDVAGKRKIARVWVAVENESIVGTVALWPPGADGSEAWLDAACDLRHLAVAASHRGGAVSNALLDAAERWATERGFRIALHVRRGALGVANVYTRRGYKRCEVGDIDKLPEIYLEAFLK